MGEFPAIALGEAVLGDLVMSSRFKPISGRVDQAAGLIFRVQDSANYYILRANALEGNVTFTSTPAVAAACLRKDPRRWVAANGRN